RMGIIELKSGARWQPAIGVSPDLAGLRPWPPSSSRNKDFLARAFYAIADVSPLVVSVLLLAGLLSTIYLFSDAAIPFRQAPEGLFTISDLVAPLAFFLIQLTCRRYGPARALAQMLAALALCIALFAANPPAMRDLVPNLPALTVHTASAFCLAFVLAN